MLCARFLAFAEPFPEPMLLVRADGRILAANGAAARALAPARLESEALDVLSASPPDAIASYLRMCCRSRQMLPGALALYTREGKLERFRAQGALYEPRSEAHDAAILLCLRSAAAGSRFARFTEKIDALTKEVARRREAEATARACAERLEQEAERERERLLAREHAARLAAERALAEAEAANRAKDQFLSTLSHELRTPLTAILGWSNILQRRTHAPAVYERALATIERNARVQASLVEDILDMSRIVTGKLRLDWGIVDLPAVVRAAVGAVRRSAEAKGVRLEARMEDGPLMLQGDAERVQQIVQNLLSNAVKFTPAGGRVDVALERHVGRVGLRVADTGQGIAPEFLPHVFERFRQADASYTRAHGGLGLGLAIAQHLAEMHGGIIVASSEGCGRGSTFVLTLPVLATDIGLDAPPPESAVLRSPRGSPLRGLRILITDDQPDSRELVAAVLAERGAEVVVAESALHGLALLEQTDVDVLISDIGMPDLDGHALLQRARLLLSERGRYVPALALTAYASPDDARAAYAAGFEEHLPKPVLPDDLAAAVARLAGRCAG